MGVIFGMEEGTSGTHFTPIFAKFHPPSAQRVDREG